MSTHGKLRHDEIAGEHIEDQVLGVGGSVGAGEVCPVRPAQDLPKERFSWEEVQSLENLSRQDVLFSTATVTVFDALPSQEISSRRRRIALPVDWTVLTATNLLSGSWMRP